MRERVWQKEDHECNACGSQSKENRVSLRPRSARSSRHSVASRASDLRHESRDPRGRTRPRPGPVVGGRRGCPVDWKACSDGNRQDPSPDRSALPVHLLTDVPELFFPTAGRKGSRKIHLQLRTAAEPSRGTHDRSPGHSPGPVIFDVDVNRRHDGRI